VDYASANRVALSVQRTRITFCSSLIAKIH